jgi:hypothetical protein
MFKNALNSASTKCRCGKRLGKPQYGDAKWLPWEEQRGKVWYVPCSCGSILVWSFPDVWKQSHELELGRTNEIVPDRFKNKRRKANIR